MKRVTRCVLAVAALTAVNAQAQTTINGKDLIARSTGAASGNAWSLGSTGYVGTYVTVPAGETDKLLVSFNAETACYGGSAGERCLVGITVDNAEIAPAAGSDSYFDNNGPTDTSKHTQATQAQHAIVRISPTLSAGAHTVRVELATTSSSTKLKYDDWTIAVQRVRVT